MASSQIEIVNYALAELGADLITSMSDPVKAAVLASAMWPICTEAVMRSYPWNCLIKRASLTPDAQVPLDEWEVQFTLPPTCLRVLRTDLTDDQYVVEGRKLLADSNTVKIKYLDNVSDVTLWDPLFVHAVTARLAQALAYPLVQSQSLKDTMGEAYRSRVREARSIDAQEGKLDLLEADDWLESRG